MFVCAYEAGKLLHEEALSLQDLELIFGPSKVGPNPSCAGPSEACCACHTLLPCSAVQVHKHASHAAACPASAALAQACRRSSYPCRRWWRSDGGCGGDDGARSEWARLSTRATARMTSCSTCRCVGLGGHRASGAEEDVCWLLLERACHHLLARSKHVCAYEMSVWQRAHRGWQ